MSVTGRRRGAVDVAESLLVPAPIEQVWAVLCDTGRYAEWVESCLEVTYHHGAAALGGLYKEVGHGLGPLTVHTTWRVAELSPPHHRRDVGTGMPLVTGLESIFELSPADGGGTRFTWHNRYHPSLGMLGRRIDALQQPQLRAMMRRSMARLCEIATAGAGGSSAG